MLLLPPEMLNSSSLTTLSLASVEHTTNAVLPPMPPLSVLVTTTLSESMSLGVAWMKRLVA